MKEVLFMIRKNFYLGFLGFLGFFAGRYFMTGDITSLAYLGFFSFFGFFFLGKIQGDQADERYQEDRKTALAFIGHLALFLLAAIWIIGLFMSNLEVTFILVVIAYVVLILAYAVKLYLLEER